MATIQERQAQKRLYVDAWSTREKLCLASAVLRSGDQNWNAVSRTIKPNADVNRPLDWMVPKACAVQYQILLDSVETPKRKKRVAGEKLVESSETAAEYLVRKLTQDHQEDLKKRMDSEKKEYFKVKSELEAIENGSFSEEDLDRLIAEMDLEDENKRLKEEEYKRFLVDREQKKRDYERPLWKSPSVAAAQAASPHKSNLGDKSTESSSTSEVLETKPSSTPTSPLLTSLLQSPSPLQRSSVLSATPTISNLLNSAPAIPHYSTDSPTLTKLLESRTSPRSNPPSLAESSIANKADLQSKQMMSTSQSITSQATESSTHLGSSSRLNKSPVGRLSSRSAPSRVDSNPDISSVVRCLYMEDVMDRKARVGIEKTQLLLNQANVDLSKVDEQKLQDEIVDMIVEQQETDGMSISSLSQSTVNPTMTTAPSLPTVVKIEVSEAPSSLDRALVTNVEDSSVLVLSEQRGSGVNTSRFNKEVESNDEKITIKIEDDIPIEIAGNSPASINRTDSEFVAQTTVPISISVETTQTPSLSQAEISVVGMSPIKNEPADDASDEPSIEVNDVISGKDESKSSVRSENSKQESLRAEPVSSDSVNSQLTSKPSKLSVVKTPLTASNSQLPLKEAQIKIGRVDESESKEEASVATKDGNGDTINFNQNVIILDADLDPSDENIQSSGDIIIDNDTEVIIAKDVTSTKSNQSEADSSEVAKAEPTVKEDVECITSSDISKAEEKKVIMDDFGKNFEDSESDSAEVTDIMKDSGKLSEDKDRNPRNVKVDTSKRPSRPESSRRTSKSVNEKTGNETKETRRSSSTVGEKKVLRPSSEKKEILKKGADEDEDEIVNDGDDEDDSDEQMLSSLKKSGLSPEKRQAATRKKSTGTAPTGIIPPVSDFVDTSSDTHSTGGDDSESTSTSISTIPQLNKKTNAREKRDSVNSSTSSSHEEKELRAWKKSIMLVYNRIATHKYASLFLKPITEDQAPGYHNKVKQPMDLLTIKKNIENGTLKTTLDFQRAIMLMFTNALFFNWCGSEVYKMTKEMMMDTLSHIQLLVQTMGEGMPYAQSETETPEKQARTERIKRAAVTPALSITPTPSSMKRKRSGMETPPMGAGSVDLSTLSPAIKRRR